MIQNCNSCNINKQCNNKLLKKNKPYNNNKQSNKKLLKKKSCNTHWLLKLTIIILIVIFLFLIYKEYHKTTIAL
jgi:hypothetical protein